MRDGYLCTRPHDGAWSALLPDGTATELTTGPLIVVLHLSSARKIAICKTEVGSLQNTVPKSLICKRIFFVTLSPVDWE